MKTATLTYAGLTLYARPKCSNKFHLPVCSSDQKEKLYQLRPNHLTKWEEVDFDGCPTMCYVFSGKGISHLNSACNFTSFFGQFSDALGKGPVKEYFNDLWVKDNNLRAKMKNSWEEHHGVRYRPPERAMSVREAAKYSII